MPGDEAKEIPVAGKFVSNTKLKYLAKQKNDFTFSFCGIRMGDKGFVSFLICNNFPER